MCKIIKDEGICVDTVSKGEMYTALKAGIDPQDITLHGSNKSEEELCYALENGIGCIVIDSMYEISVLNELCEKKSRKQNVHIRVTPNIEAHTHEYVQTGRIDSKFGIPIGMALRAAQKVSQTRYLKLTGIHCHIGSQIFAQKPFIIAANNMLELMSNIEALGLDVHELNLGGGFGVNNMTDEELFSVKDYASALKELLEVKCPEIDIPVPKIIVEPGRYIIDNAGITLYTVGTIKEIPYMRKYVSVDGGLFENPRPGMYDAVYRACVANRFEDEPNELVTISGRCCETDTLINDILLPKCYPGDIVAVINTGAYNYSMAGNYNRLPRPAIVLLKGDKSELMVRRETEEDLVRCDEVPSWLK
jgi:diaminopimelate decarboxylase